MESSSSDEEDYQLPFWNNWFPPSSHSFDEINSTKDEKVTNRVVYNFSANTSFAKPSTCGNWVPPVNFFNTILKRKAPIADKNDQVPESKLVRIPVENFDTQNLQDFYDKKKIDDYSIWEKKMELYDLSKFNEGDLFWGVVNLGIFVHIKLWVNEHGVICGSADGRLSKLGSSEITLISITNVEFIRKILGLSSAQWTSLCETIQETKTTLKFDALENFTIESKSTLEKLWWFICKRRHFLPDQCMLVKCCGAVKCMRSLKIIPKVVVQEIRSYYEQ